MDGKSIYLVHEVNDYEGFGQTGAVSLWKKGRDPLGKPIFQKVQVPFVNSFLSNIDL